MVYKTILVQDKRDNFVMLWVIIVTAQQLRKIETFSHKSFPVVSHS